MKNISWGNQHNKNGVPVTFAGIAPIYKTGERKEIRIRCPV